MALTGAPGLVEPASGPAGGAEALHVRPPAVRHFVRLKLRILANGMQGRRGVGRTRRVVTFIISSVVGFWMAAGGFMALAAGSASADHAVRAGVVGIGGGVLTLAWLLLPLLFFGVDETLDPARFALLPVPRRTVATGMLAAACVGVPSAATLIAGLGLVVGGASRGGPAAAGVAVLSAVLGLLVCVVGSRAMTSAFATMLRSRKMRDIAVIVIVLLASSLGPLQLAVVSAVEKGDFGAFTRVGTVLTWTPLAAPYGAALDAIDGRWSLVIARLAIGLGTLALLLWWWSRTLESAMLGTSTAGPSSERTADGSQPVAGFIPRALRWVPVTRFTAIVFRDLRYFWRDPRWRASIASMVIAALFLPIALIAMPGGRNAAPLPMVAFFVGVVMGMSLANIFGSDGLAFAGQLLAGVPGRVELRARVTSLALVAVPLICVVSTIVGVVGDPGDLPAMFGLAAAAFGTAAGGAVVAAVFLPYPMPQSGNPFAVSSGGASLRSLIVFAGMIGAAGATGPVIAAYVLLPDALTWLVLPIGIVWGTGAALLGSYIAGDALDRRGPEVLVAITPRG